MPMTETHLETLRKLSAEMRSVQRAAGQCSVEGPHDEASGLFAAEAERAGRWADELDAALSALAPSGAGWQPIATAPKENWKYVLAWDAPAPKKGVRMAYRVGSTWSTVSGGSIAPTHWPPLPAPPTQEAE